MRHDSATHDLSNKVVFITGGGSWIGKEIALQFAARGACIFITGRNAEKLRQTCQEIKHQHGEADFYVADTSNEAQMVEAIQQANSRFGKLDIMIPNAAIYPNTSVTEISLEEWQNVLMTNLAGAFIATKLAAPFMIKQNQGRIIYISSVAGDPLGVSGYAHYAASKSGINGLMRVTAVELGQFNITVNCICPGNICNVERFHISEADQKKMLAKIPLQRIGQPEDVAQLALFLASNAATFITGQAIICDGGECISQN